MRSNVILDFDHDHCFWFLFCGKGREGREKGYILLHRCNFVKTGIGLLIVMGMGSKLNIPFK